MGKGGGSTLRKPILYNGRFACVVPHAMTILINALLVVHVLVSVLIIMLVLMQRPRNEGLGAAFDGGMTESIFGPETASVLQSGTRWLGILFFALTLLLSVLTMRSSFTQSQAHRLLSASANIHVHQVICEPLVSVLISRPSNSIEALSESALSTRAITVKV